MGRCSASHPGPGIPSPPFASAKGAWLAYRPELELTHAGADPPCRDLAKLSLSVTGSSVCCFSASLPGRHPSGFCCGSGCLPNACFKGCPPSSAGSKTPLSTLCQSSCYLPQLVACAEKLGQSQAERSHLGLPALATRFAYLQLPAVEQKSKPWLPVPQSELHMIDGNLSLRR